MTVSSYTVGLLHNTGGPAIVVGNDLQYQGGSVHNGPVVVGGTYTTTGGLKFWNRNVGVRYGLATIAVTAEKTRDGLLTGTDNSAVIALDGHVVVRDGLPPMDAEVTGRTRTGVRLQRTFGAGKGKLGHDDAYGTAGDDRRIVCSGEETVAGLFSGHGDRGARRRAA